MPCGTWPSERTSVADRPATLIRARFLGERHYRCRRKAPMKLKSQGLAAWLRLTWMAVVGVSLHLRAQVTITSDDMFNQVGQYYLAYSNGGTNTVSVAGMLGTTGGPQAWDFSSGPQDVTNRFDYLIATNVSVYGPDFGQLGATLAEQKTDLGNSVPQSWLFFKQDAQKGRIDYGFVDPNFSASQPENVFTNGLQDFPASIHFGDSWQGTTVFSSVYTLPDFGDFPDQITYTSTDKVDAYGVVVLPGLGFLDCLRIHEVVEYDISLDFGDGSGLQPIGTQYLLNYYWLSPGHGIVVQINSAGTQNAPPTDDLPGGAAELVRMFETNHAQNTTTNAPPSIKNFTCTLGKTGGALLKWTLSPSLKQYTVEYTTNLTKTATWVTLQTVTNNFVIDIGAASKAATARLYRVLGN